MSKVNVEFDTLDKTLSLTVDGKAVQDVAYVSMGKSWGSYSRGEEANAFTCCFETQVKDEENDMNTCVRVCASESDLGKKTTEGFEENEALPGFKIIRENASASKKFNREQLIKATAAFFNSEENDEK